MAVVLGLLAALSYGASDFLAGLGSRRLAAGPVTLMVQSVAVGVAIIGVVLLPGDGPAAGALAWGALSGVGSGVGTLALYRGLAVGAMSPVATCSAVLAAVLPAIVGLASGDDLSFLVALGIVIALPAIALVSWPGGSESGSATAGAGYGLVAGLGFGLLFIALDQAGTSSGAWPLLPSTLVAVVVVAPFARGSGRPGPAWRPGVPLAVAAGVLGGLSNLLFLRATGEGQLTVVAVLTSLYPAATVLLARIVLTESWTRLQAVGLVIAAGAVVLVSVG